MQNGKNAQKHRLRRAACLLLLIAWLCVGTGCTELTGLDAQTLMSPPKTTADRQAIYALMRGEDTDISLVYPKNGDYRSAIISRDLDLDSTAEVVSFCMNGEAGGIRLQFFSKDDTGAWRSLAQFTSAANQVDKVFFGDLTGDGVEEIVVGWGDPQTLTASFSVYTMANGGMHQFSLGTAPYAEMLLTDFDGDSIQELFVTDTAGKIADPGENSVSAPLGKLYRFDGDQPYVAQTVPLDSAVTRYSAASFSKLNTWRSAVVLDGVKADGRMITQVIGFDSQSELLTAPLTGSELGNPTDRPVSVAIAARDINSDGILEFPIAEKLLDSEESDTESTDYIVSWNTYSISDRIFTPVTKSVVNVAENYCLLLPEQTQSIGCTNDSVTRTVTFFTYSGVLGSTFTGRENLFSITVYSEEGFESVEKTDTQMQLLSAAGRVYVLNILDPALKTQNSEIQALRDGFKILYE